MTVTSYNGILENFEVLQNLSNLEILENLCIVTVNPFKPVKTGPRRRFNVIWIENQFVGPQTSIHDIMKNHEIVNLGFVSADGAREQNISYIY